MVAFPAAVLMATLLSSAAVSAYPLAKMGDILAAAQNLDKRGLLQNPAMKRAFHNVNEHGLDHAKTKRSLLDGLVGSVEAGVSGLTGGSLSQLLELLDLPTPQAQGLAAVPDAAHPYKAPGSTDVRGLCPTLNTMANHGYISRTGITTFAEAANACQIAYGFAFDICTGLSALGLLAGGDLLTGKMSIGGADSRVPNTLGQNQGIDVHGPFEIDGSITRADTYFGDNHSFQLDRWNTWVKQANETSDGLFDFNTMVANQKATYAESKANNPEAYFGVKYFVVALAERVFIPAALPNGTTPDVADYANIAPFFLEERFPPGWFRRPTPYDAASTVADVVSIFAAAPFELGANENGEFVGLGLDIPTDDPTALMCFFIDALFDALPSNLAGTVAGSQSLYNAFASSIFGQLFGAGTSFGCDLSEYGTNQQASPSGSLKL